MCGSKEIKAMKVIKMVKVIKMIRVIKVRKAIKLLIRDQTHQRCPKSLKCPNYQK